MKNRENKTNAELIKENEMLHKKVNELENAEEAVLESNEKYRSLTEHLNVGIYRNTIGSEGRFIEVNPAIVEMFAYKKKNEFLKLNVADLYKNPGERKKFNDKLISKGIVKNEEIQLQKSDGTFFFGSVSAVAVKDENGKIKYYDGIIEDITDSRLVEKTLKESENKYRLLAYNSIDAIWQMDLKLVFTYVSPSVKNIMGYTTEEWIGSRLSQHVTTKEFFYMARKALHSIKHYKNFKYLTFDTIMLHKDGTKIPLEIIGKLLKNKNGLPIGLQGTTRDITERKQTEKTLRESEEKYRTLVESLEEGIVAVDENENFIFVNPAICKIFGYTKEELLQMNFKEILSPEDHQKILQQTSIRKTGKTNKYDMNIIKKNGDICIVTTSVSPIFKNGKFKGSFGVFQDITERKKTEQALHKYTLELQERNEELDAFSHTVAHDLKNPLGTIMGFAELLFEEYSKFSKDEILNYLNIMIKDSKKTQQIIDNLLLFASVRKAEIKMEELNMRDIVAESINSLTSIIEKSNAEIILSDVLPPSLGYAPWVEEVWTNYLSNAIKYGGTPPRIKIGADTDKAENVPKGMVRFWIRDNGQGISADNRRLLFEKFERLDQITTEGHGLGLSIVRRIIEKLGGQVGMENEQGKGSLFYFTLPFATNTLSET